MRVMSYRKGADTGLAVARGEGWADLGAADLLAVLAGDHAEAADTAPELDLAGVTPALPLARPGKIICVGLNYADHTAESPYEQPNYPTLFPRFTTSLIPDGALIVRPRVSQDLDFEGEVVAIIGKTGRHIARDKALEHVAGYSIFNDGSLRDYQFKSPQWTVGKNFDDTGAFGPYFVTADALPEGCKGLKLVTRLNGETVQEAMIDDMVFSVAQIVSICSQFMTLEPGDVIVTGTPSGVGLARKPQLFMKDGDVCEVEIDQLGVLSNPVRDRLRPALAKTA